MALVIKDISELTNYDQTFYVYSTLKVGWVKVFISGYNMGKFELPTDLKSPMGFRGKYDTSLGSQDKFINENFKFDPKSHFVVYGYDTKDKGIVKESIDRFVRLCEREHARFVMSTIQSVYYTNFKIEQ